MEVRVPMVACRDFCIQKGERSVMVLPVVGVMTKNLGKISLSAELVCVLCFLQMKLRSPSLN